MRSLLITLFTITFFCFNITAQTLHIKDSARVSCNGGNDAYIIASAAGGTPPYLYGWYNSSNAVIDGDSAVSGLSVGNYTVTILDAGFTVVKIVNISITQPTSLGIGGPTVSDAKCNGQASAWASIDGANGGSKPYTYKWTNGDSDSLLNDVIAGTYTATVIDAKGCRDRTTVPVGEKSKINIATGQTNVSCLGGNDASARATASGGTNLGGGTYNYSWSNDSTDNAQIISSVTKLTNGSYTVTVTDFFSCTATAKITITQPSLPVFVITNKIDVTCPGGSDGVAYATPGGGTPPYFYKWVPNPFIDTDSSSSNLTAGNYVVTVYDGNSCKQAATVNVADPTDFVITFDSTGASCFGASDGIAKVNVTGGTGGYTYSWSNGATTDSIFGLSSYFYVCTVTDAVNCNDYNTVVITEPASINIATTLFPITCYGGADGALDVNVTGGTTPYTYKWSNGETTDKISDISSGTYTISVTDANNCISKSEPLVSDPPQITFTTDLMVPTICNGDSNGMAVISASGGTGALALNWEIGQTGDSLQSVSAGSYIIVGKDFFGCKDSANVAVTEPDTITVVPNITQVSCFGKNDGSISISTYGANGGYTYSWSTGDTDTLITNVGAGNYTVTVIDSKGCGKIQTIALTAPNLMTLIKSSQNISCFGGTEGNADVIASGGTLPYTYNWSSGETLSSISSVKAGLYVLTITDVNTCKDTAIFNITQPDDIVVTISVSSDSICKGQNANLSTVVTGGDSSYTYAWDQGAGGNVTTVSVSPTSTTTYTCTVNDGNTCLGDTSVKIYVFPDLSVEIAGDTVICQGDSVTLYASSGGGNKNYIYQWNTGSTDSSIAVKPTDGQTFSVTLDDNCGNTQRSDQVSIDQATIGFTVSKTLGCEPVSVVFTDTSKNVKLWNYQYSDGGFANTKNDTHVFDSAGVYTVTLSVQGPSGCIMTEKKENIIEVQAIPISKFTFSPAAPTVMDSVVFTNATGCASCTWLWTFGDDSSAITEQLYSTLQTPVPQGFNDDGNYVIELIAKNAAGCSDTSSQTIKVTETYSLIIPNAFTPDGNGNNDEFFALGYGVKKYKISIYGRTGILVFQSFVAEGTYTYQQLKKSPVGEAWNGRYRNTGDFVPNGIYAYRIEIRDLEDKDYIEEGHITVIR